MLWLSTLDLERRLTALLALKRAFPSLQNSRECAYLIDRVSGELAPSAKRLAELARRAERIAEDLKEELEAA